MGVHFDLNDHQVVLERIEGIDLDHIESFT